MPQEFIRILALGEDTLILILVVSKADDSDDRLGFLNSHELLHFFFGLLKGRSLTDQGTYAQLIERRRREGYKDTTVHIPLILLTPEEGRAVTYTKDLVVDRLLLPAVAGDQVLHDRRLIHCRGAAALDRLTIARRGRGGSYSHSTFNNLSINNFFLKITNTVSGSRKSPKTKRHRSHQSFTRDHLHTTTVF